jgi:hypothetical protein
MNLISRRIAASTLTILVAFAAPAAALTDREAAELLSEVRALRRTVEEQNARIRALEERVGGREEVSAAEPTAEAPSPDLLGAPETPGVAEPSAAPAVESPFDPQRRQSSGIFGTTGGFQPQIGVIFDATYSGGPNVADDAQVREVELNIGAPVDPNFDLFFQAAFTPGEIEFEQGYVTARLPANLQARFGLERLPFGGLNATDQDGFPQTDRPHVLQNFFGAEGLSGIGGHIEWLAPWSANPSLSAIIGLYNRAQGDDDDDDGFLDGTVFNVMTQERGPLVLGRVSTFWESQDAVHALRFGGSVLSDENDRSGATRTTVSGIDAKYRWTPGASGRGVTIAGEYLRHDRQEGPTAAFLANSGKYDDAAGFYAYGQYDFNRRWSLGYRYDRANSGFPRLPANLEDANRKNEITANSIYAEWRPSEFSRLRAQYRRDNPNNGNDLNGNGLLNDEPDDTFMFQFTHLIGWHPAHKF